MRWWKKVNVWWQWQKKTRVCPNCNGKMTSYGRYYKCVSCGLKKNAIGAW